MAFQNPYEYHNNYSYINQPPDSFDAESTQSQFSNFEQHNYQKDLGLRSGEHGIVGPVDQNTYNDVSYRFDRGDSVDGDSQKCYGNVPPVSNYHQRTEDIQTTKFSPIYSESSVPANNQRTGHNALSALDHGGVDDPGDSSQLTTRVSDSPPNQREVHNRDHTSRSYTNQARSSPKASVQSGVKGNLKIPTRTTVHDRSKLAAKKPHKRNSQLPPSDAVKTSEQLTMTATTTDQTDAFTQWYQMMSQYYSQFYPGYQLPQPPGMTGKTAGNENTKASAKQPERSVKSSAPNQQQSKMPAYVAPIQSTYPGRPSALTNASPGNFDYATYYYQYYYEAAAAAAAQMWSGGQLYPGFDPSGRQTPKFYPTPHVRAGLTTPGILIQILPNRPLDGELARIELLDLSVLANDAVAEATQRAAESGNYLSNLTRLTELRLNRDQDDTRDGFSSGASGLESPGHLSSVQAGAGGDDEGEEVRACAAIAVAWDRTNHVFYPGPLMRNSTLKADVLVYLRDKLAEIQDRLPIDWESAGLLISYLEFMVKNNGNVQPSDLVRLLLEGHELQTSDLRARCSNLPSGSTSYAGTTLPNNMAQLTRSYMNDSLASLPPSQAPSGRQSPQTPYGQGVTKAASETGGFGTTQALLRRAAAAVTANAGTRQIEEDKVLDRFRELLMHGMSMKALEHACRSQLWGHAFVLAHRMGPTVFEKVMDRFLTRAIPISDPILTLYQLTAGELPQAVNAAAYGRGTDNGEWRPHLAMILAAESNQPDLTLTALERLGDSLLSRRLVYAAHLCYLLMGPLFKQANNGYGQPVYQLPEKIWLLGVNVTTSDSTVSGNADAPSEPQNPLTASTEAIQLTEVYEYAMRLANPNYRLPQLLPFKLVYATRLIDAGLLDKAFRYLTAISNELLLESSIHDSSDSGGTVNPVLYSLVDNCLRLAEPLQNHPELDGFELTTATAGGYGAPSRGSVFANRSSSTGGGDVLLQLRELYDRMNRQLGRAQYAHTSYPIPKRSTEAAISSEIPTSSQTHPGSQDPNSQSGSGSANQQPYGQALASSFHSSVVETSSSTALVSAHPVRAQAAPFIGSQPLPQSGRSETSTHTAAAQPSFAAHSMESQHTQPSSMQYPSAVDQHQPDYGAGPVQQYASTHVSGMQPGPGPTYGHQQPMHGVQQPDPRVPLGVSTPETHPYGSNQPNRPGQYPSPGGGGGGGGTGSVTGPAYQSNLFGIASSSTSTSHGPDGSNPDFTTNAPPAGAQHAPPPGTDAPQPQPNSMFFTPVPSFTNEQTPGGSPVNASGVFDYFAGLQPSEQQPSGSRSRTVSGCSQGSTSGAHPHTRSRNSSGMGPPRRGSTGYDRQPSQPMWGGGAGPGGSHTFSGQTQSPKHAAQHTRDLQQHQQRTIKEEPHSESDRKPVQKKKEENSNEAEEEEDNGPSNNAAQSKDGWFSGWLGRLKRNGSKNVHLPDDSKPSIVWDDQRKQWVDVANPDDNDSPPPPPPLMVSSPSSNVSSMGSAGTASRAPSGTGFMSSPPSSRVGARSRYVNVLANQTAGSAAAKLDTPLQPPLPVTGLASPPLAAGSAAHQSLQYSEHNLRPPQPPHSIDTNNNSNIRANFHMDGSGSAGLMMYN